MTSFQTHSPIDNRILFTREYATAEEIHTVLERAKSSQKSWKERPLHDRISLLQQFVDAVVAKSELLSKELTEQMGRPIRYSAGEIRGFAQRAQIMDLR